MAPVEEPLRGAGLLAVALVLGHLVLPDCQRIAGVVAYQRAEVAVDSD